MHREMLSPPPGMDVDHINGNPLDNRRANLRVCTRSENNGNLRRPRHNTSGFKGVCWEKWSGKWKATIKVKGKSRSLGRFLTPEDAHGAYCAAARAVWGEFAYDGESQRGAT